MSDIFSVDPNLPDWIRTHTEQYLNSGGEEGHMWDRPDGSGPIPVPAARGQGPEVR